MRKLMAFMLLLLVVATGCASKHQFAGTVYEGAAAAGDIEGMHGVDGEFSLADHRGQFVMISFGYTTCPDVCPVTLSNLASFYGALEAEDAQLAEQVAVVFVSVDPERDAPDLLKAFAQAFHPSFYGVHIADAATLEAAKTAYGVQSQKRILAESESVMGYLIDHTAGTFVVGPEGNLRLYFSHNADSDAILADMMALLKGV